MRSRPDLRLFLASPPAPGQRLLVKVELVSRSETPIDAIDVFFRGKEQRYSYTSSDGSSSTTHYKTHHHVALGVRLPARVLAPGVYLEQVAFDLPPALPPSFKGRYTTIEYEIDVRVDIPWWPDRRARFAIAMPVPPGPAQPSEPLLNVSASERQRVEDPYLESSLEDGSIAPDGTLRGAVSAHNLRGRRIRRIEMALIAIDVASFESAAPAPSVELCGWTVFDGSPPEGQALPFVVRFPDSLTPSFRGVHMALRYAIEVRAIVAWGTDVVMRIPITVVPSKVEPTSKTWRVPPVGAERRAMVWARAAEHAKLSNDAAAERMLGAVGRVDITVRIEDRREAGSFTVATLRWPDVGIDVELHERKWHQITRAPIELGDPTLRSRFGVQGREEAQVRAFLEPLVARAISTLGEATLADDGCVLATRGDAFSFEEVAAFLDRVVAVARAVDEALDNVPPPAALQKAIPAWRAYAAQIDGALEPGLPRIVGHLEGETVEVVAVWKGDALVGADLVIRRSEADDGSPEPALADVEAPEGAPAAARAVLEGFVQSGGVLRASARRIVGHRPGPLMDPSASAPVLRALAAWSRALRGVEAGPFR